MSFNNLSQDLKDLLFEFWSPSKELKEKLEKYKIYLQLMWALEGSKMDSIELIEAQQLLDKCVPSIYLFRVELFEQININWHTRADGFVYMLEDDL